MASDVRAVYRGHSVDEIELRHDEMLDQASREQDRTSREDRVTSTATPRTDVHGVVLAGVHSWGNAPLERGTPRPLIPVADRPLILHTLGWLRDGGVASASVCANSDTGVLRSRLGNGHAWGVSLDYYEDVMPRGPAGCTRDAVADSDCSAFVVVDATIIPRIALDEVVAAHRASKAALTIVVTDRNPAGGCESTGACPASVPGCRTNSSGAECSRWLEPVGLYVFSRAALELIPSAGYQDIKEALVPRLHAEGRSVLTYRVDPQATARVTGASSYLAVNKLVLERISQQKALRESYRRRGHAVVHDSAKLDPSVRLVGPVLIEPGCVVEAGALIVGPTSLGAGCTVGAGAVVSRSAIWSSCSIGAGAVVDHSVLTDYATVSAGRRLRNDVATAGETGGLGWLTRWRMAGLRGGRTEGSALDRLMSLWETFASPRSGSRSSSAGRARRGSASAKGCTAGRDPQAALVDQRTVPVGYSPSAGRVTASGLGMPENSDPADRQVSGEGMDR